jgi:glutathione S-transferase
MTIVLYVDRFWISPYAYSSFVALEEKRVPFTTVEVALDRKEQLGEAYRAGSLTNRVPAIEHDGFWLSESSAIAEYLEDEFPAPGHAALLPEDPRHRARARQLMAWIRSDLMPIREERPTHTMFYDRATAPMSAACQLAATRLLAVAEKLIGASNRPGQLFPQWSLADADLGFMLMRLVRNGEAVPARVAAYAQTQWDRAASRRFIDHARPAYVQY